MLRINLPSAQLPHGFGSFDIPQPSSGTDTEVNGDVILLFEDEEEAVAYLDTMEDYASSLDDKAPERDATNLIVTAIQNDEFVQTFFEENE